MTKKDVLPRPSTASPFTLFACVTQGQGELEIALLPSYDVKLKSTLERRRLLPGNSTLVKGPSDNPSVHAATPRPSVRARVLFTTASFLEYDDDVYVIVIKRFYLAMTAVSCPLCFCLETHSKPPPTPSSTLGISLRTLNDVRSLIYSPLNE